MTRRIPRRTERPTHEVDELGELVVLDAHGERLFVLNPTGAALYELVDGRRDVDALVAVLTEVFPGEGPTLRADVDDFLSALEAQGLVHIDTDPS